MKSYKLPSAHPTLQLLAMDDCGLEEFPKDLASNLPTLTELSLVDNEIAQAGLNALSSFRSLVKIAVADNPVASDGNHHSHLTTLLPSLQFVDLVPVKTGAASISLQERSAHMQAQFSSNSSFESTERCSCTEGNACAVPDNCKDWANRDAVAAAARKAKGIRD